MDRRTFIDPVAAILSTLSGITIILVIPPLVWHYQNRNFAACCLIFWLLLLNFFNFINAIIWSSNDVQKWYDGRGLCDVEVKLFVAATVALPIALVRIMRSLALVLDSKKNHGQLSDKERRRRGLLDIFLCLICPTIFMVMHYIVQPNRYYVLRVSGCQTSIDNSWVSVVLLLMWPLIFTVVDSYYAGEYIL